jgi:hypothetical protein
MTWGSVNNNLFTKQPFENLEANLLYFTETRRQLQLYADFKAFSMGNDLTVAAPQLSIRLAENANPASFAMARFGADDDVDILSQRGQQAHQPLAGKVCEAAVQQSRDLRLIDSHQRRRGGLRQAPILDDLADAACEFRFGKFFLRLRETQIPQTRCRCPASLQFWLPAF